MASLLSASRTLDTFLFGRMKASFLRSLAAACADCASLLDVGCGAGSPIEQIAPRMTRVVGVDAFAPALAAARATGLYTDVRELDVMAIGGAFEPRAFDAVLAADLLEHLPKTDGHRLLDAMERIAARRVIIFTPNGFVEQDEEDGNPHQAHRSGWTVAEFEARGYRVKGISGWKPLRGRKAAVRWPPRVLWVRVSLLTQRWVEARPEKAFSLLCVKDAALD